MQCAKNEAAATQVKTIKESGVQEATEARTKANKIIDSLHDKLEHKEKLIIALQKQLANAGAPGVSSPAAAPKSGNQV